MHLWWDAKNIHLHSVQAAHKKSSCGSRNCRKLLSRRKLKHRMKTSQHKISLSPHSLASQASGLLKVYVFRDHLQTYSTWHLQVLLPVAAVIKSCPFRKERPCEDQHQLAFNLKTSWKWHSPLQSLLLFLLYTMMPSWKKGIPQITCIITQPMDSH